MPTIEDFRGPWKLTRQITDHLAGQFGQMTGQVVFEETGTDSLRYSETGTLQFGGGPVMQAIRRYNWRFAGERVIVTFEDGRAFHSFRPKGCADGTDHPCGEDHYSVRYNFAGWPEWEAVWRVRGPRKDYVSISRYSR